MVGSGGPSALSSRLAGAHDPAMSENRARRSHLSPGRERAWLPPRWFVTLFCTVIARWFT